MFPRSLRLGRQSIEQSRKLSRATTPHFSISYGNPATEAGFAVIVPKKAVKSAVGRHKLKRRLRESLLDISKQQKVPQVIVIAARSGSDSLAYALIHDELSIAFKAILAET